MFPTDQWPAVRTVDEYPAHLVSRMDGPDGWFNQLEHVLEPLDGGRARLHYVHSGIFAENWDQQYDGASKHTEFYLHTLGQYLKYFDGKPVVFTDIQAPRRLGRRRTALSGSRRPSASRGRRPAAAVELELDGVGRLSGEVDFANENFLGLRTADTLYRFFGRNAFGATVGMTVHDFSGRRGLRDHGEGLGRVPREGLRLWSGVAHSCLAMPGRRVSRGTVARRSRSGRDLRVRGRFARRRRAARQAMAAAGGAPGCAAAAGRPPACPGPNAVPVRRFPAAPGAG